MDPKRLAGIATTESPGPAQPAARECAHGNVWVVDTATRRVVRRTCPLCQGQAVPALSRPHQVAS